MKQRLAYIDDCKSNLDFIGLILENDFAVEIYQNPLSFLKIYDDSIFTAILVDVHMPLMSGFALYEKIIEHKNYDGCPIYFISVDNSDATRIKSFSLGTVDFLNRLMSPGEILARIKSQINFFQKHRTIVDCGNIKLNLTLLKTFLNEGEIKLTFLEFKFLSQLLKNFPGCTQKEELIVNVWSKAHVEDATIYTHIFNINSKLEGWDHQVISERGKGIMITQTMLT